jgi:excisionase family DNA binding protein
MKSETTSRRLMKAKDAIEYLGVSRFTFDRLIHSGQLPVVQFGDGGKWLIDLRDLESFVARCKTTSPM